MKNGIFKENIIIAVFLLLMSSVVLLIQSDSQPWKLRNEVADGKLFCFCDDTQYWSQLTDFCVKDNYLYVLFGGRGVLKVYDNNGKYIKSFAFMKTKGESSLYVDNDYVYLFDQDHNYYIFSFGEFIDFVRYSDYGAYLQKKTAFSSDDEKWKSGDTIYYLKGTSIFRRSSDNLSRQVIHRPLYLLFFQGVIPFIVIIFWMITLLIIKLLSRKVSY